MDLSRRQIELLLYLIQSKKPEYGSMLAERLSVTDRTVRNDVLKINRELKEYGVYISASKKDGYYISGDCLSRIRKKGIIKEIAEQFDFDIPETQNERMVYLLFSMIFNNRYSQEDIMELLYLSLSVVYGDLKMMEKWLHNRRIGLELKMENGFYFIDEEESIIRSLISGIYTQRVNMVLELKYSYFISGDTQFWEHIHQLLSFVCDFLKRENLMLTGDSIFSFCTDIALTYYRTSQKYYVTDDSELSDAGERFKQALLLFDAKYSILTHSDYSYLMHRLAGKDYLNQNPFLAFSPVTEKAVECFTDKAADLGKAVIHPEYICNEIETILYSKHHRYYYSVNNRTDIFKNNLEYLYLTILLGYCLHTFYPDIELDSHDMARLTVCLKSSISSLKKHIMLVSDFNRYIVEETRNEFNRIFSDKAVIERVATQYDYQQYRQGIDGIISTAAIDEADIPCMELDIHAVDTFISDIQSFLDSLHRGKMDIYEEHTEEKELLPILKDLLVSLRKQDLVQSEDFKYVLDDISANSIFHVRNNSLFIMIPMLFSESLRQFNIIHSGEYKNESYSRISLIVFSNDISALSSL